MPASKGNVSPATATATTPPPPLKAQADQEKLASLFKEYSSHSIFLNWAPKLNKAKTKWLKAPEKAHPTTPPTKYTDRKTLSQAFDPEHTSFPGQVGLILDSSHPIISLDLDGTPPTEELIALLQEYPTHISSSPSGKPFHWRILYQLPSIKHKLLLLPLPKSPHPDLDLTIYSSSKNFNTLTTTTPTSEEPHGSEEYSSPDSEEYNPPTSEEHSQWPTEQFDIQLLDAGPPPTPPTPPDTDPLADTIIGDNTIPILQYSITTLPVERLLEAFPWATIKIVDINTKQAIQQTPAQGWYNRTQKRPASPTPFSIWKRAVPLGETNLLSLQVRQAFNWSHRDLWVYGCMAIYMTFPPLQAHEYALAWSQADEDPTQFDQSAFDATWKSIDEGTINAPSITTATYHKMFNLVSPEWPDRTKNGAPSQTYRNFLTLLKHLDMHFKVDAVKHTAFLVAPKHILRPHFYGNNQDPLTIRGDDIQRLSGKMLEFAMIYNFVPQPKMMDTFIRTILSSQTNKDFVNRLADKISSLPPYDKNKEPDYLSDIANKVLRHDKRVSKMPPTLHKTLVKKWMLSLGRTMWPEKLSNPSHRNYQGEGLLILSELEGGSGKSTFIHKLMPSDVRHYMCSSTPQMSKDWRIRMSNHLAVDIGESGYAFSKKTRDMCKDDITARTFTERPPYGTGDIEMANHASLICSTNNAQENIPQGGHRRYWWLNVENPIDLDYMDSIDKWRLWAQIYHELSNYPKKQKEAPWSLSPAQAAKLNIALKHVRTASSQTIMLTDLYDFSPFGWKKAIKIYEQERLSVKKATHSVSDINRAILFAGYQPMKLANLRAAVRELMRNELTGPPRLLRIGKTALTRGEYSLGNSVRFILPAKLEEDKEA